MSDATPDQPSIAAAPGSSASMQPQPQLAQTDPSVQTLTQMPAHAAAHAPWASRTTLLLAALSAAALLLSASLWMRLSGIQEALARQSLDATTASVEGRTLAKSAQEAVKEVAARQVLLENRLSEVAVQRGQLEGLIQSLSHSRDENLVVDVDSAIRLAQQQANLTGSLEPLLAALKSAELRVSGSAQPRLAPLQRALAKDIDRVKAANVADTPSLLIKLDELVRLVDDMPLANAVAVTRQPVQTTLAARSTSTQQMQNTPNASLLSWAPPWLQTLLGAMRQEAQALVRVSRIDAPEAALLSPEQSFFARENLKLMLLNARLALLARQFDTTSNDLRRAARLSERYFDTSTRSVQQAASLLAQLQTQLQRAEQPRVDDTLAALATLSAVHTQGK